MFFVNVSGCKRRPSFLRLYAAPAVFSCSLCMFVWVFLCLSEPRRWVCICGWISAYSYSPPVGRAAQNNSSLWLSSEEHSPAQWATFPPPSHIGGRIPFKNTFFPFKTKWTCTAGDWSGGPAIPKACLRDKLLGSEATARTTGSYREEAFSLFIRNVWCGAVWTILQPNVFETRAEDRVFTA